MSIRNKIEFSKETNPNSVLIISKGVLIALIISAVLIIIYGLLLSFTSLSESSMPTVITAISTVSIAFSGIYVAVKVQSRGWLNGALMGLIYMVVLFLISLLFNIGATFDKYVLFKIFMGFIIGGLSGVIGINLK